MKLVVELLHKDLRGPRTRIRDKDIERIVSKGMEAIRDAKY